MTRNLLFGLIFLALVICPTLADRQAVPQELVTALDESERIILYSVYPQQDRAGERFLGYPVLGRTELPYAKELASSVLKGLEEADASIRESCFAPRHGLVVNGRKLLICYQCHSVIAELKDGKKVNLAITDSGNQELAEAVARAELPWQGWQPVDGLMKHQSGLAVTVPEGYRANGAAGTETLYLQSLEESVQSSPMPGAVVLEDESGASETVPTKWIDHAGTGNPVWYFVGASGTFQPEKNRRIYRAPTYKLDEVRNYLLEADKPAELPARIRLRPVESGDDAKTQIRRFRRQGHKLEGKELKTARVVKDGIEMDLSVATVQTSLGPVMVVAEIPTDQSNPLPQLLKQLQQQ